MKLQLLYLFVFAAPLLARLLSPEPSTQPTAAESAETTPAKAETAQPASKTDSPATTAPAENSRTSVKSSSLQRLPTAHGYSFM